MTLKIGSKFNKLTVISFAGHHHGVQKKLIYKCQCDCGNFTTVIEDNLKHNNTKSCGCENHKEINNFEDITGFQIGELEVIKFIEKKRSNHYIWEVLCKACNSNIQLSHSQIKSGTYLSCGCRSKQNLKASPEYKAWLRIKQRCYDPNHKYYDLYGAKGIEVFKDWKDDFNKFLNYILTLPETFIQFETRTGSKATIDRIDNSKNYEPGNIRIMSYSTQARNRSSNTVNEEIVKSIRYDREINKIGYKELIEKYQLKERQIKAICWYSSWKDVHY